MITEKEISEFKPKQTHHGLIVYTSQFRYSGPRRLDITAMNGSDLFRPDYETVMAFKNGGMTESQYEKYYLKRMRESYKQFRSGWERLLSCDWTVLVCYCRRDTFCHRLLLAEYLEKCGASYEGEVPNV